MARRTTDATIRSMTKKSPTQVQRVSRAKPGDWIVIHPHTLGEHERTGLVLEVLGTPSHERYRVRWDEEHESVFYPGSDATVLRDASRP